MQSSVLGGGFLKPVVLINKPLRFTRPLERGHLLIKKFFTFNQYTFSL